MAVFVGGFIGVSFLLSFCRCGSFYNEFPQKRSGKGCVRHYQFANSGMGFYGIRWKVWKTVGDGFTASFSLKDPTW